ncbi:tetratricopeptide repeat protein [Acetobacteraceae bacterium]|nr:tetratricopeptide repeat protein [Acetobacteraceae bacterium]
MSFMNDSLLLSQNTSETAYLEITEKNFMQEALEGSVKKPFLLQFFTDNDPISEKLLPILEKTIQNLDGAVRLGRLNVLQNRALCQQLIQSGLPLNTVPITVLFIQGKIIDLFQGFQPADSVHKFIENAFKKVGIALPSAHLLEKGFKSLEENKPEEACAYFGEMIEKNNESPEAWNGLLRALIAMDEIEGAQEAMTDIPEKLREHPEIKGAMAAIEFAAKKGEALSELETLKKEAELSPENLALQFRFIEALNAAGEPEKAADSLLSMMADKSNQEASEQAKQNLLHFFEAWGETDLTRRYRRKLSSLLFS